MNMLRPPPAVSYPHSAQSKAPLAHAPLVLSYLSGGQAISISIVLPVSVGSILALGRTLPRWTGWLGAGPATPPTPPLSNPGKGWSLRQAQLSWRAMDCGLSPDHHLQKRRLGSPGTT